MTSPLRIPPEELTSGRQGHYAGAVSRLVAFAVDVGVSWGLYTLGVAIFVYLVNLITGVKLVPTDYPILMGGVLVVWEFVYFAYQWALGGKTVGMAIFGVRVVRRNGSAIGGKEAAVRTVTFPLGFLTLGLGFLGILVGRERRALYDRIAGTCVVYDWDARAARLRWLARQEPAHERQRRAGAVPAVAPEAAGPAQPGGSR